MEKKDSPMIYGAIAAIMNDTKAIAKSQKNQQQNFMFRGIDNVMNDLHDIFAKHNVFILPEVENFDVSEKVTGRGTILYYTRAVIKFHFTALDGSEVVSRNVGEAMDSGDKGMNKAMSIALKYALMQMLLIPTEEKKDPDADTPPETRQMTTKEFLDSVPADYRSDMFYALQQMLEASTVPALLEVWKNNEQLHNDPEFKHWIAVRKIEVQRAN